MKYILLVDEDQAVKDLIKSILTEEFPDTFKVVESSDGADAIRKVEKQKFDCVITNSKLPKIEDDSLIRTMMLTSIDFKPVNILVLSTYTSEIPVQQKIVSYLTKPIDKNELVEYFKKRVLKSTPSKASLNVGFINPFIRSTVDVIQILAEIDVTKDKVFLKDIDQISGDISAIIPVTCSRFNGSFAITFQKNCFLEIASKMLGEEYTTISIENQDAAGEICNQVFGQTKAILNDEFGLDIAKALPTLVVGQNHIIQHQIHGPCISVKFKTQRGSFCIEAVLN